MGRFAYEPFWVCGVGGVEYAGTLVSDCFSEAVMDVGGSMHPDSAVAVLVVVPGEEILAVAAVAGKNLDRLIRAMVTKL